MILSPTLRQEWFGNVRGDLLSGLVVALALIPEAIAFSIIAGVDPSVGLYASFCIAVVIAFAGGRPGMISAATGAMALVMVTLVRDHGLQYLLAATLLTGLLQILAGALKLGALMRFVSRSVITGFVNALAILIFMAQIPELIGVPALVYPMVALGLAIIYLVPRVTQAIPSPLICILVLTALSMGLDMPLRTVTDLGRLPDSLPSLVWPQVPLNLETLRIVFPYALAMAMVGLLESMMTAGVVDDWTETNSSKRAECTGLGIANIAVGAFGGIAGCGMIGQTVGNLRYGGRGRLSTLVAGAFLLVLMVALKPWVSQVPVVALVAIMVMVSVATFDWRSLRALARHPRLSGVVMLATVAVTLLTHNLAAGVGVGVLLSGVFFALKVARLLQVGHADDADGVRRYRVSGQVFFASADAFIDAFDPRGLPGSTVEITLADARLWDITAVAALDTVVSRFRHHGIRVRVHGMDRHSRSLLRRVRRDADLEDYGLEAG